MNGPWGYYAKWNKSDRERQILYDFTYMWNLKNKKQMSRWMDKEDVVHIYNGVLLSHKKEWNWVICWDVDGSRNCHTEWSNSEREKQISYINAYMWNVEKWYR